MKARYLLAMCFFTLFALSVFSQRKGKKFPNPRDYQLLLNSISNLVTQKGDFILRLDSAKITFSSQDLQIFRIGISPSKNQGYPEYEDFISFSIYLIPKIKEHKLLKFEIRNQKTISDAINLQKPEDKKRHPLDSNDPIVQNFLCGKFVTTSTHSYNRKFDILVIEEKANFFAAPIDGEKLQTISLFFESFGKKYHQINPKKPFLYVGKLISCIEL